MDRVIKFIILVISILVGLGLSLIFIVFLAPLFAGGFFLWSTSILFIAVVMFFIKMILGLWLIANDEEKELTEADKNFTIKQGREISN